MNVKTCGAKTNVAVKRLQRSRWLRVDRDMVCLEAAKKPTSLVDNHHIRITEIHGATMEWDGRRLVTEFPWPFFQPWARHLEVSKLALSSPARLFLFLFSFALFPLTL